MAERTVTSSAEWKQAIAEKAGVTLEEIDAVLDDHDIRPQSVFPRTRRLRVRSVRFGGIKHGETQRFEFLWEGLDRGLWGIFSGGNSKGKSSIINIIRCALQGRFPGDLKADIWKWLDAAEVTISIDEVQYSIALTKDAGSENVEDASARLERGEDPAAVIYDGKASKAFEQAMSDLFTDELGFDRIHAFHKGNDAIVEHGWPAMSSALFIRGPGGALFGEQVVDGLPIRLVQWFIGLPWISTYTAAAAAEKRLSETKRKQGVSRAAIAERTKSRVGALQSELDGYKGELEKLPDRQRLRRRLIDLDRFIAITQADVTASRAARDEAGTIFGLAKDSWNEARRAYQQAKDDAEAGYVFRRLKPRCCPACEADLNTRFKADEVDICGLCGTSDPDAPEGNGIDLSFLKDAVADAAANAAACEARATQTSDTFRDASQELGKLAKELEGIQRELSVPDQADELSRKVAITEALIKELSGEESEDAPTNADEIATRTDVHAILKAVEKVTKALMEQTQAETLKNVGDALLDYSVRLGVQNLESMTLHSNKLEIKQGGADETFSKLSPGENLRVRVALALSVVSVARASGVGRHPGLLVLDSPGSQEMASEFASLMGSLGDVIKDEPELQIIIGAVHRPEIEGVVPASNRKQAFDEERLF
ncbi:hypothetical protein E0H68_06195 [Rhizobium leguminosarum bv. viciae]|uniref:hypothetical protein n=1 Tax=Rhizobium leguminosarum TaxID=384 RepID=UPI00103C8654|nr:hypothetical protein [Rhizobium leguminosarum]TCA17364.1 hypothetical protein E0H68_06195 [Rhizobium leguminosarum bv. viciae]